MPTVVRKHLEPVFCTLARNHVLWCKIGCKYWSTQQIFCDAQQRGSRLTMNYTILSPHNKVCAFPCKLDMQEGNLWIRGYNCVGFEVYTAVFVKNADLWNMVLCGSHKNRHFRGICHLQLQGRKKSISEESVSRLLTDRQQSISKWLTISLFADFSTVRWRRHVPPKRRFLWDPHSKYQRKVLVVSVSVNKKWYICWLLWPTCTLKNMQRICYRTKYEDHSLQVRHLPIYL
jgi:hypothetical protein